MAHPASFSIANITVDKSDMTTGSHVVVKSGVVYYKPAKTYLKVSNYKCMYIAIAI